MQISVLSCKSLAGQSRMWVALHKVLAPMVSRVTVEVVEPAVHAVRVTLVGRRVNNNALLDCQVVKRDVAVEVFDKTEIRIEQADLRSRTP